MKWASSMSGELNNCASYFSPFANVNQNTKTTMDGSTGGPNDTWQEWEYEKRTATAKKVEAPKAKLRDPSGKERTGAPNESIVQNHINIALLNVL